MSVFHSSSPHQLSDAVLRLHLLLQLLEALLHAVVERPQVLHQFPPVERDPSAQ